MADVKKLADLAPDTRNANKGTERGSKMIADSLATYGAGRSILIDKNGKIIAGNKTTEGAAKAGIQDVIVVQTDGTKLVAVQRMDLDLEKDHAAIELAIADNRAGQVSLEWDVDVLKELESEGVALDALFTPTELVDLFGESETAAISMTNDSTGSPLKHLKIGKYLIPLDEAEYATLVARIEQHAQLTGSLYGFAQKLIGGLA